MRLQKKRVALVIPAYNEGSVIREVVSGLRKTFQKSPYSFQIIVIDDGSRDSTVQQARLGGAHVISHILNVGSGGATATGLSYAYQKGFDIVTTSDADGQHRPQDVLEGVNLMARSKADLLIGSRLIDATGMSRIKIFGNSGLSFLTNILFGISITDSQSGLRVFSKQALALLKWKTSGYEFCSEMLWRAGQLNLSIHEYPIKAIYSDYSTTKPYRQSNWNAFNIVKSLLKQRILELFNE